MADITQWLDLAGPLTPSDKWMQQMAEQVAAIVGDVDSIQIRPPSLWGTMGPYYSIRWFTEPINGKQFEYHEYIDMAAKDKDMAGVFQWLAWKFGNYLYVVAQRTQP